MFKNFLFLSVFSTTAFFSSCSDGFDGKNGTKTVYFPNSKIVRQVINYKDGKKNGISLEYFRNGKIKTKQAFENDTLNDSAFVYHDTGKLAMIQFFKNKKREGCWKKYHKNGNLYIEFNYKDDLREGSQTVYSFNANKILKKEFYKEDRKHGKQEQFYENQRPKSVTYFRNGVEQLGTEEWYDNGKKVKNEIKFNIIEKNTMLIDNNVKYLITLENQRSTDKILWVSENDTGRTVTVIKTLPKEGNAFVLNYTIYPGSFVMERVRLAAYRTTLMKNTIIKTTDINVAFNHF